MGQFYAIGIFLISKSSLGYVSISTIFPGTGDDVPVAAWAVIQIDP